LLGKAGIIESHQGITAMKLVRPLRDIRFLDVYRAIELPENSGLFSIHQNTNPHCVVGQNIQAALEEPLLDAQKRLEQTLALMTVEQVVRSIHQKYKNISCICISNPTVFEMNPKAIMRVRTI
jgi:DNA-binding IscR family transcriptional regulator